MIYVIGTSHLAQHVKMAVKHYGMLFAPNYHEADLILCAEDTPTGIDGVRHTKALENSVAGMASLDKTVVLMSQVPPGFTRKISRSNLYHQPECLRIITSEHDALHPTRLVVGCADPAAELPPVYLAYLKAFGAPILKMSYESAEFSKIAVNMWLASQVECTNRLSRAAARIGADWKDVSASMRHDKRIGVNAYLTPGRWQDSKHLLRDAVTLAEIEK